MPTLKVTSEKIGSKRHFHISFQMRSSPKTEAPSLFPDPIRTCPSDDRKTDETLKNELISRRLSRLFIRHPNKDIQAYLTTIHKKLGEILNSRSDKEILWLLGGNKYCSRGGFRTPEQVRSFLNLSVAEITTSALMTKIETLVTAIAYRGVNMPDAPNSIPKDREEQSMHAMCKQLVSQKIPPITLSFPTKILDETEDILNAKTGRFIPRPRFKKPMQISDILVDQQEISEASDVEEDCKLPLERLPGKRFSKYSHNLDQDLHKNPELSFPGKSRQSDIPIRCHVSGSAPLALAAIEGILASGEATHPIAFCEKDVLELAAPMLLATYDRGDFHSFAETQAGIFHFIKFRFKLNHLDAKEDDWQYLDTPEHLNEGQEKSPSFLLPYAYSLMTKAIDSNYLEEIISILNSEQTLISSPS